MGARRRGDARGSGRQGEGQGGRSPPSPPTSPGAFGRRSGLRRRAAGVHSRPRDGAGGGGRARTRPLSTGVRRSSAWTRSAACRGTRFLALATGSQGEPRAALARMASDDHPAAELVPGNTIMFSSRTIPGNEKAVGRIVNALAHATSRSSPTARLVDAGPPAPRRSRAMYGWLRPRIAVPRRRAAAPDRTPRFRAGDGRPAGAARLRRRSRSLGPAASNRSAERPGRRYKDGEILLPAARNASTSAAASVRRRHLGRARAHPERRDGGRSGVMIAGLPERTRSRRRLRRDHRRRDLRDLRKPAPRQAPRPRRPVERDRAQRPRLHRRDWGQEPAGARAGGGGLIGGGRDRQPASAARSVRIRRRGHSPVGLFARRRRLLPTATAKSPGGTPMIGKLNHITPSIPDLEKAANTYR